MPFRVENIPIDFSVNPFEEFYRAYGKFEQTLVHTLGLDMRALCNNYLTAVQGP